MDPNETLKRLRALTVATLRIADDPPDLESEAPRLAYELAESFEALDQWLSGGGFLPRAWAPQESPRTGPRACAQCGRPIIPRDLDCQTCK